MEAEIQKILDTGAQINTDLNTKLTELTSNNNRFNEDVLRKLNALKILAEQIRDFKARNAEELQNTKIDLARVTKELESSKADLFETRKQVTIAGNALQTIRADYTTLNNEKTELEKKLTALNTAKTQLDAYYNQQIMDIKKQNEEQMQQERQKLEEECQKKMDNLNKEKTELENQLQQANIGQNEAGRKLQELNDAQEELIVKLGTINELLARQLQMISDININQPNYEEYNKLLEAIEQALSGVMRGINSAVSSTTGSSSSGPPSSGPTGSYSDTDVEQNYNKLLTLKKSFNDITSLKLYLSKYMKCKKISQTQKDTLSDRLSQVFTSSYKEEAIKSYLKDYEVFIPDPGIRGGKRKCKRKTMKKRPRKTRKYQKGGYTYNKNDKLDKASSVVSNSSSNGKSRRRNRRSRHRSRK